MDVNSMKPLDNLCHPISVIREAEELAAEAFGAKTCISDGRRNNLGGTEYGAFHCEARGEDHSSEKCTPERDGSNGVVRSDSGIRQSGVR